MEFRCAGTGSKGNSYALVAESGEILLIECGVKWSETMKIIDYQTSKVSGCVASHAHSDHLRSYKDCLHYGIPIYTNDETAEHFEIISGERMIGLPEKKPIRISEYTVIPLYVPHDGCACYAFLIYHPESGYILYATDMIRIAQIDENYRLKMVDGKPIDWSFKNLRLSNMIIEANYDFSDFADIDEFKRSHVGFGHHSLQCCKRFVEENKTPDLRNVILVHLSKDTDEENIRSQVQSVAGKWVRVDVAHAGMELELSKYPF